METYQIFNLEHTERQGKADVVSVYYTTPDGSNQVHGFPTPLISFTAAAYSIDMSQGTAMDDVLDCILYRRHYPDPYNPANLEVDVAAKAGMTAVLQGHKEYPPGTIVPVTPYTAESPEQAMIAQSMRMTEIKKTVEYVPVHEMPESKLMSHAAQVYHMSMMELGEVPDPLAVFRSIPVAEEEVVLMQEEIHITNATMLGTEPSPELLAKRAAYRAGPKRAKQEGMARQTRNITLNPVQGNPSRTK